MSDPTDNVLHHERFPRSSRYDAQWVFENEMGPNALWLVEWLCEAMDLQPGMRVLDLGCGRAMTSVFLAREFGVQVFATDLWIAAADNWRRVQEAGVADRVVPIHAEAHALPFADGFFDAMVSLDAYHYFGTDDLYLNEIVRFLRPGAQLGIVVPGLVRGFDGGTPPDYMADFWDAAECFSFHTLAWWRRHWEQTRLVDIETADLMPEGWKLWLTFKEAKAQHAPDVRRTPNVEDEPPMLRADRGRYIGFPRLVARRR